MHHTQIYVEIRNIIDKNGHDHGDSLNIKLFSFPISQSDYRVAHMFSPAFLVLQRLYWAQNSSDTKFIL